MSAMLDVADQGRKHRDLPVPVWPAALTVAPILLLLDVREHARSLPVSQRDRAEAGAERASENLGQPRIRENSNLLSKWFQDLQGFTRAEGASW